MKTSQWRIALLTGASLSTLGLAAPGFAQEATPPHVSLADGTYPGTATTADTIEICDLATPPGSPCFFGVIDTATPLTPIAAAAVSSTANGQIVQNPGATGTMANNGTAEVGAIASAANGTGNATANAMVNGAIFQTTAGAGDIALALDNNGTLLIDALANAGATGTTGDAFAHASVSNAVVQSAVAAGGDVSLRITNDGALTVLAVANASAPRTATAVAQAFGGIIQGASASFASQSMVNSGTIALSAKATATGGQIGGAFATASLAMGQGAFAGSANESWSTTVSCRSPRAPTRSAHLPRRLLPWQRWLWGSGTLAPRRSRRP